MTIKKDNKCINSKAIVIFVKNYDQKIIFEIKTLGIIAVHASTFHGFFKCMPAYFIVNKKQF